MIIEKYASDELKRKIVLWRGMANNKHTPKSNATTLRWCANELEEMINND